MDDDDLVGRVVDEHLVPVAGPLLCDDVFDSVCERFQSVLRGDLVFPERLVDATLIAWLATISSPSPVTMEGDAVPVLDPRYSSSPFVAGIW
nr:hypothetical protein [Halorientalis regularis]